MEYLQGSKVRFEQEYGVLRIGLFGSSARDEQTAVSDIDILVSMDSPTFDRYMDLKFELEDRFGAPVDLVLQDSVKDRLRDRVEQDALYA
jgi:hypothetical protein